MAHTSLPPEIDSLKKKLHREFPGKTYRFSLSSMKHKVQPLVKIPPQVEAKGCVTAKVSGKAVPFTRNMWQKQKKSAQHLDYIDEDMPYRGFERR